MPLVSKQKIQKAKGVVPVKSKENATEKTQSRAKPKRKTAEPPVEGAPKKKLLASTV